MENQDIILHEIRYVRGRVDELHDKLTSVSEKTNEHRVEHVSKIARLEEQSSNMKWVAGKIAGIVAGATTLIMSGLITFLIKKFSVN